MIGIQERIGKNIRDTRKKKKISQRELANRLKISVTQLQKYENGENNISVVKLYLISEILDTDILLLILDGKNNDVDMQIIENNFLTLFQNIKNPEVKQNILELVKNVSVVQP